MPASSTADNKGEGGPHWSTDYVEHLRTVHFSLIAVCVVLIVLSSSRSASEIHIAHEEIRQIQELCHNFRPVWFGESVRASVREDAEGAKKPFSYPQLTINPRDANAIGVFSVNKVRWDPSQPKCESTGLPSIPFTLPDYSIRKSGTYFEPEQLYTKGPNKLADFRAMWDGLEGNLEIVLPRTIGAVAYCEEEIHYMRTYFAQDVTLSKEDWDSVFLAAAIPVKIRPYSSSDYGLLRAKFPDFNWEINLTFSLPEDLQKLLRENPELMERQFTIPITAYATLPYDGLSALISHSNKGWDWKHGRFDYAFFQLSEITKNYQDLDLDKIETILSEEEKRTGESFEAVGIKFPAENTTRWGIFVILGIQFYFWIHLRERAHQLRATDPGWEVAWVGVYPSGYARAAMFISTRLLPVAAALALGIRGLFISSFALAPWLLLMVGISATWVMGTVVWKQLPRTDTP